MSNKTQRREPSPLTAEELASDLTQPYWVDDPRLPAWALDHFYVHELNAADLLEMKLGASQARINELIRRRKDWAKKKKAKQSALDAARNPNST